jgi:hypothetical protein
MDLNRRLVATLLVMSGFLETGAAIAAPKEAKKAKKAKHNDGRKLVADKIRKNGRHEIAKKGPHTVLVDVKDGKIAGMNVKHQNKGDVPVTKYKSKKKMVAQAGGLVLAGYQLVQAQSLGEVYIGYAYIDEYGYEEIYWYPYEMIWDGDTGAVEYVPIY